MIAMQLNLPAELDTPAFREAWAEWEQHRREIKQKLTPLTTKKQLKMLAGIGADRAIATIEKSIEKGWRGLFPEQTSGPSARSPLPKLQSAYERFEQDGTLDKEFGS